VNSPLKVLVADDEPTLRHLLQTNLELEGYETYLAENGEEALEAVRMHGPDIVLLDVMMPVMDGWAVLDALTREPGLRARVILVSAKASGEARLHGWRLGCDEYVTKPFDLDDLMNRIAEVGRRTEDENRTHRIEAIGHLRGQGTGPAPGALGAGRYTLDACPSSTRQSTASLL
jgi:DNA-binding response OmpR family regulator